MNSPVPKPAASGTVRRRMTPGDRRRHILDAAAKVVVEEGISAASVDRIAVEANVSKALVYAYFENRYNLLAQLLLREFPAFQGEVVTAQENEDIESIVRRTTTDFIDRYVANGVLIQRLLNEPAVAENVNERQAEGRAATANYFGKLMTDTFGVPADTAVIAADLLMSITGAAARMRLRSDIDRDRIVDLAIRLILGAAKSLGERRP